MMAYYYFDFSEADKRTLGSFVRSLLIQLTVNLPGIPQELFNLYIRSREMNQEPSTESLREVLRGILIRSAKAIIVVDALDECSEPEELVEFIGEMKSWRTANFAITSRQSTTF